LRDEPAAPRHALIVVYTDLLWWVEVTWARSDADMSRLLITLGALLLLAGALWPWLRRVPLFHLPGDIQIDQPGFRLFLPVTSMLVVSAGLSLLAWLLRR